MSASLQARREKLFLHKGLVVGGLLALSIFGAGNAIVDLMIGNSLGALANLVFVVSVMAALGSIASRLTKLIKTAV